MANTKEQIRDRAGNELGILPLGQAMRDQDRVRIEQAYYEVYDDLKSEGIATWSLSSSVPNELTPWVVALVCDHCLDTYGVSNDRYTRLSNKIGKAKREIRRLTNNDFASQEDAKDY